MNRIVFLIVLTISAISIRALAASTTEPSAPPAVGSAAADFQLSDLTGTSVKLSTLADASRVVLVVLRGYPGYQCPYCTRQFADFKAKADAFAKAGVSVVFIYPGPADQLKAHAEEFTKSVPLPPHFHLLIDPDYTFTNAYGLRWDAPHETAYPSTFVIDQQEKITFAETSRKHSNRVKAGDVLTALGVPSSTTKPQ